MKIYLARNNVQAGPYTLEELNAMLMTGEVLLSDLVWHKGMKEWQKLGDLTLGRQFYWPANTSTPTLNVAERGFGDNVELSPHEIQNPQSGSPSTSKIPITKTFIKPKLDGDTVQYAKISLRISAFLVNMVLLVLAVLPLLSAFGQVMNVDELAKLADYASIQAYTQSLATQINPTTIMISNALLLALVGIQLLLIVMRGQSFGKMVMGIRVVDANTGKLPRLGTLLFGRGCFLVLLYVLVSSVFSALPALLMLTINYVMANKNPKKQGWHDRLTGTTVVKTKVSQLDKLAK